MSAGFIGLGLMGEPMAMNLLRSGVPLVVWNRTGGKCDRLRNAGARVVAQSRDVFRECDIVFLMLSDENAVDAVLHRGTNVFNSLVASRTIIQMGTMPARFSAQLAQEIRCAGGDYVEAPVSGSRKPAEDAGLVVMIAGEDTALERAVPLLQPMSRAIVRCGEVPNASLMKLAVNVFLIAMVTGLAEAVSFARAHQLDVASLRCVLDYGPMASSVSRGKVEKLEADDFAAQASIFDVLKNNRLIVQAARDAGVATPLLDVCHALFSETLNLGHSTCDMVAVIRAIEARTAAPACASSASMISAAYASRASGNA